MSEIYGHLKQAKFGGNSFQSPNEIEHHLKIMSFCLVVQLYYERLGLHWGGRLQCKIRVKSQGGLCQINEFVVHKKLGKSRLPHCFSTQLSIFGNLRFIIKLFLMVNKVIIILYLLCRRYKITVTDIQMNI